MTFDQQHLSAGTYRLEQFGAKVDLKSAVSAMARANPERVKNYASTASDQLNEEIVKALELRGFEWHRFSLVPKPIQDFMYIRHMR